MRVNRPLLTCLALFFFFSNVVFSQSSLFNDAKELANFLEEDNAIKVRLKKGKLSNASISIKRNDKNITPVKPGFFSISTYGQHDIEIPNWEDTDSVFISYRDSLYIIVDKASIESVSETASGRKVRGWNIYNDAYQFVVEILLETDPLLDDPNVPQKISKPSKFQKENLEFHDIQNVLNIMNSHANFKFVDTQKEFSIINLQRQYAKNPFLNNLNLENNLFAPDIDAYFSSSFFSDLNSNFPKYYYKNNPWSKLIYGDSILQLQKTVSFEDTNSSYRTRIVSSQKELTEASIRIDRTSKSKNLLDAKTVAVGLSDFIAERAQEELNLTFFNRFKKNMENPSELTVLFPNTKKLLNNFEISNYKTLLSHARKSFTVDLENLGLNFPKVLKLDKYEDLYNSPEVFNLSLIYSIADLAYKEVPVETILISGFQKLQERKSELKKSINIELADAFIADSNPNGKPNSKMTQSLIRNNPQLDSLKSYVKEYLNALNTSKKLLDETSSEFNKMVNGNIKNVYDLTPETGEQIEIASKIRKIQGSINQSNVTFKNNFKRDIFYNNRRINDFNNEEFNLKTSSLNNINSNYQNVIFDFYENTVLTNLRGHEYYGYIIQNPRIDDYENYLKIEPDSINGIIAEGLEGSRNLIDENFDQVINQRYQFLAESTNEYRIQRVNYRLAEKTNETRKEKTIHFFKKIEFLKAAIKKEISFWEKSVPIDQISFHIAGLKLLDALIYEDPFIRVFHQVAKEVELEINTFEQITNKFYENSFSKDFNENLIIANERLDSIKVDFLNKIEVLNNEFGDTSIMSPTQQVNLLETEFERDSFHIEEKIKIESQKFLAKRFFLENSMFVDENGDSLILNNSVTVLPNFETEKYLRDLKIMEDTLALLQTNLRNAADATERNNISNKIDIWTDKKEEFVENRDEEVASQTKKLEDEHKDTAAKLQDEKEKIIANYQTQKAKMKAANSLSKIKDIHRLEDNYFFEKFLNSEVEEASLDYSNYFDIDAYDLKLDSSRMEIEKLKNKSDQLQNYIATLENRYCKDLIEAEKNAKNLSVGMEIATHLLFAFRDYEKVRDTLFFKDSVFVKVTVNQLDSLSGFTNTYSSDSMRVIPTPIKGTTDSLLAARWITKEEFTEMRKNDLQWNIFLGLLYQRLTAIEDAPDFSPRGVAVLSTKFLSIANDMNINRNELRRKKAIDENAISFKDYYPFIRSTVDLFNTVITTPSIGDTTTVATNFGLKNIPYISNEALSLYENIYAKNYGNAVLNSMQLLKIITKEKRKEKRTRKEKRKDLKDAKESQLAINSVLTYGTFMANMINAESSDQIKNILKSATLPPGSSRIKRETVTSFTINSYLGAAVGRDRLLGIPDNLDLAQDAFGASLSVPIGFTYSFSPSFIKRNSSFSIHLPLIDLGAITAYRQNPDNPNYSIDDLPDFSWNNLFSPGLFAVYNFAESPFSAGVGGQYGPQLRQITINTGEAVNVNSWRFPMVFFTVDVPFFNLHTGARKIIVK